MVRWLGHCAYTAGGVGSIPGWGTRILHATRHGPPPKKNDEGMNKDASSGDQGDRSERY